MSLHTYLQVQKLSAGLVPAPMFGTSDIEYSNVLWLIEGYRAEPRAQNVFPNNGKKN